MTRPYATNIAALERIRDLLRSDVIPGLEGAPLARQAMLRTFSTVDWTIANLHGRRRRDEVAR